MVKVNSNEITYNGVALSNLSIDKLRFFESQIINDIIIQNNALVFAEKQRLKTISNWIKNYIELFKQQLVIVQAEINGRYAGMVV